LLPAEIKVFGAHGAAGGGEFGGVEEAFAGHCGIVVLSGLNLKGVCQ
jgi:hypothetical protein